MRWMHYGSSHSLHRNMRVCKWKVRGVDGSGGVDGGYDGVEWWRDGFDGVDGVDGGGFDGVDGAEW